MRNPWRMQDGPDNKINRNNFPMSFQYNGTFKYGKIYPIGLWRTIPGASYQIDSTLALNFMPTSFPIQTRQRAYVHFFYGRDRNFWKDYKDFVNGMNPDLVKPYIDESVTKARTGNLLDYLGVPTTIVGSYGNEVEKFNIPFSYVNTLFSDSVRVTTLENVDAVVSDINSKSTLDDSNHGVTSRNSLYIAKYDLSDYDFEGIDSVQLAISLRNYGGYVNDWLSSTFADTYTTQDSTLIPYTEPLPLAENNPWKYFSLVFTNDDVLSNTTPIVSVPCSFIGDNGVLNFAFNKDNFINYKFVYLRYVSPIAVYSQQSIFTVQTINIPTEIEVSSLRFFGKAMSVRDIDETTSPYWRSGATTDLRNRIKLSAIPPRFYETVYNLYYRNPQNNPYILNGKPEYNVFIPTKDGGPDSNLYELRYRNWEDDFLTTAVQTPQQGIAPLVGLTDRGATVTLTNEDGSVTRYKTSLDDNGNVIGIETTDSSEPLLTQALIDAVSYGISIEDLRNVNAMQKWLELNLRKGYQYKDIIEARWGISISYNELDLPEFIGGFTQEVGLQAVTQTTSHGEGIEGALGWQAGRMYAAGSGRSIQHYCEEEGYIMALLCVVPVPNYSQLLPKHWFTRDLLDSYQPEFNHIGFQPITYKEVCPIQAYQESTENVDVLEQTFGYQRPWYEYFNQVDEVHGQFRTIFKDFLINRTFDVKPELSESFLLVDPNQINDVFAVTTDDDKIIGAIQHRITAKLPISLYAQARLE